MASDDRIALWQIFSTVAPIIAVAMALGSVTESSNMQALVLTPVLVILLSAIEQKLFAHA